MALTNKLYNIVVQSFDFVFQKCTFKDIHKNQILPWGGMLLTFEGSCNRVLCYFSLVHSCSQMYYMVIVFFFNYYFIEPF